MNKKQLVIQSNRKDLEKLYPWLEKNFEEITLEGFSKNNILLVSFEMATNAVIHGNKEDNEKVIVLTLETSKNEIIVSILDEGTGQITFPSKEESKELDYLSENGRGLKLAVLLSDSIEYENNCMKIVFKKNNNL